MASFCFMPLLNVPAMSSRRSHSENSRRYRSIRSARVAAIQPVQPPEEVEVGRRRQLVVEPRRLGQDADPGADLLGALDDVEAVDRGAPLASAR